MGTRHARLGSVLACGALVSTTTLATSGCDQPGPSADAADADGRDPADADEDRGGDAEGDADAATEAGPLTFAVSEVEVLLDRTWDLDGDGLEDNAIADLGPSQGALLAMAIGTAFEGDLVDASRLLLHFPWVRDVARAHDPETTLFVLEGLDLDVPWDPSDDFSGEEPFYAHPRFLDDCGEAGYFFPGASLTDGELSAVEGTLAVPAGFAPVVLREARAAGRVEPGGRRIEATLGAALLIRDLGTMTVGAFGGRTILEAFLGGGRAFGLPAIPGMSPDLDLDGDGLERVEVGADGAVTGCVDGDSTPIEGPDCWRDDRIADGFSLVMRVRGVPAILAGPRPSWPWEVGGRCEGFPRAPERWGPCPSDGCERWASRSCATACGGDGVARCAWDCSGFEGCRGGAPRVALASGCSDVGLEGGATCSGEPPVVSLVDGRSQTRGARLLEGVPVGTDGVVIDARARITHVGDELPGEGWGILAYVGAAPEPWLGPISLGFAPDAPGYAFQRFFYDSLHEAEEDRIGLIGSDGVETEGEDLYIGSSSSGAMSPAVDAATQGTVEQALRLVVVPDLPETEENEMAVVGLRLAGELVDTRSWVCLGDGCQAQVHVGDVLHVGVSAATTEHHAAVAIALDALTVETGGSCP